MRGGPFLWTTNRCPTRRRPGRWLTDAQLVCQGKISLREKTGQTICRAAPEEFVFCFLPFFSSLLSNLFVVPQQHYFLRGGEEMTKSLECIVIRFFDPICWKMSRAREREREGRKKKKRFCVINTNGGCRIWPGGYIYMVILRVLCVVIMIGDAIGIGADLFFFSPHFSFCRRCSARLFTILWRQTRRGLFVNRRWGYSRAGLFL